jgi:hypothetical protein
VGRARHAAVEAIYAARGAALTAARPVRAIYGLRYRGRPVVRFDPMKEAAPRPLEGYTDQPWYRPGQAVRFHLRSPFDDNWLVVQRVAGPDDYDEVRRIPFGKELRDVPDDASAAGCRWPATAEMQLGPEFTCGYYRAIISSPQAAPPESAGSAITFMVGPARPASPVAVLAPVGTWTAYNPYGGQSLYHNELEREDVHSVSALRPNPGLAWDAEEHIHSMRVETHAFNWLQDEVGADLYPDWILETPEALSSYRLVVLSYHVEYATEQMMAGLHRLVADGASLLSLGANQPYWRVRWHDDRTRLECRKDGARMSDGSPGGLFRAGRWSEDRLLGVRYGPAGTGTYAPYQVTDSDHWLFEGLDVHAGQLFGEHGMTPYPICGDETDRATALSGLRSVVIARGLNRADAVEGPYTTWRRGDPAWDGAGGGEIAITELSPSHAVLATGAIHSASGLGADEVFTGVIRNFLGRALDGSA